MRRTPGLFRPGSRRSRFLTPAVSGAVAFAVLGVGGPSVLPTPLDRAAPAGSSYDWFDDTAAEQLRQDQCLLADVLRLGGPAMANTGQNGLNQSAEQLHALANRQHWQDTPLSQAYATDKAAANQELADIYARRDGWVKPLAGLTTPAGINDWTFHKPPGISEGVDFHTQTGLTPWIADQYWKNESDFYADSTPKADAKTSKAVLDLGTPLYGKDPSSGPDWNRDLAERDGFSWLKGTFSSPMGADDARLFLASGGFARSAPAAGTAEYRVAVEDMKTRFSSCAWRDAVDPDKVLGDVSATAAAEWQQEISSQAVQRNQVVTAAKDATKALTAGAEALGQMLGHSWVADHLTRWQDFWSAGGVGWIGESDAVVELTAAKGKCLDVQGGATADGTPVQVYTCNGGAAQGWRVWGDDHGLYLRNAKSYKCLEAAGNGKADGTKLQIATCNSGPAQVWAYTPRATTALKHVSSGKCLNFPTYDLSRDALLATCTGGGPQQVNIKPSGHTGEVQPKAHFDQATKGITDAQAGAKKQLALLKAQAAAAKTAATASDTAVQAAYAIADKNGAPRGRGMLVGLQKAQVTKGVSAALDAMVKAGETAEAATRAAGADSQTIAERALAQAAQSKAEFRKEAARTAELQAKAAADAAKLHRDNAKKDKETAAAKLLVALKAETDAKAAAAAAHAKRLAAEAEEATAKAEKETAAAKQAEAAQHRTNAEAQATKAENAKKSAEASEATAVEKRNGAFTARDNAKAKRDEAWQAEQLADVAGAKAAAKQAFADAHESDEFAKESREAADASWAYADAADVAAGKARGEADAATKAAADADAAATRAEAAAKRSRAAADAAQAEKLKADAAIRTATSAAADAIAASDHAAAEARIAVAAADEAERQAKTAKSQADVAFTEAANARAASAKAAGYAYVTAQAAVDASTAAAQVAKPANDAIQLGSPYVAADATASLVVLTGQSSKTIAEQQKAVAEAHAKNAKDEAAAAKALADAATGDAKQAYVHAANAAGYAAEARGYAKEALGYAAEAAESASKATASLARSVEYGRQAAEDALAAGKAAGRAEGYAKAARDSADQAALDAEGARQAATRAEQAAKDARAAAVRADAAATEAEQAAKDAQKFAEEAQEAADRAEAKAKNEQISSGGTSGIPGFFYVINEMKPVGDPEIKKKENCNPIVHTGNCVITAIVHFDAYVDMYLCTAQGVPATKAGCPASSTEYIGPDVLRDQEQEITRTLTMAEFNAGIDPIKIIFGDFIECAHKVANLVGLGTAPGSWTGCAWAATWFIPGRVYAALGDALHAVNVAMHTGVGIREAFAGLRALRIDPATLARLEETASLYERVLVACERNSFPGGTPVLMADGSHRAIRDVRAGDRVLTTDPRTGGLSTHGVTDTYRHDTERLVDIDVTGGRLTSTAGHRMFVIGRGWTTAAGLRAGDRLRTPEGAGQTVTALRDRSGLAPRTVFDLTVGGPHSFYVRPQGEGARDVLVHNCLKVIADEGKYGAHTIGTHVNLDDVAMQAKAEIDGVAGRWTSKEVAEKAIQDAMAEWTLANPEALKAWTDKMARLHGKNPSRAFVAKDDCLFIDWTLKNETSLGKVWKRGGTAANPADAGNKIRILLRFTPKPPKPPTGPTPPQHYDKFVVFTSYPLPK